MRRTWDDGKLVITVEVWGNATCGFTACTRDPIEGTKVTHNRHVGSLFIDYQPEAVALCKAAIAGEMETGILADWIEDRPETWRCPCPVRDEAVVAVCERLRFFDREQPGGDMIEVRCEHCENLFATDADDATFFCSLACERAWLKGRKFDAIPF